MEINMNENSIEENILLMIAYILYNTKNAFEGWDYLEILEALQTGEYVTRLDVFHVQRDDHHVKS